MSASEAVTKASVASTLNALGFHEVDPYKEAEAELLRLMINAGAMPLELDIDITFSEILDNVGEAVITEAVERGETLLEVLKENMSEGVKAKVAQFLTMDVIDVIAMIAEASGKNPADVYSAFAEVDSSERPKVAVATLAKVLVEAIRKEQ
ncbi:hypothetical protein IPA_01665 [Ignicoccus pacificus DSM 13166]|uniref:Uncharacterized protein n=1 Tax=Ignicoccus pacificus DSM 13166 TaxID=940294 RepID=A0A977KAK4_9CREN|nr:hypothetical protein IPA_01665 [Ignicoccus pacificus DSM 13166]